jgi:hypothetical protein
MAGTPAATALTAAGDNPQAAFAIISAEIFTAPFCAIISNPEGFSS